MYAPSLHVLLLLLIVHNIICTDLEGSFKGLSKDGKIAIASSVTVFVVTSVLFFFTGYLCGRYHQKYKHSTENTVRLEVDSQLNPIYDGVQPKHEQLEMKTNVAYDLVR